MTLKKIIKVILVFPLALCWDLFYTSISFIYNVSTEIDTRFGRSVDKFL